MEKSRSLVVEFYCISVSSKLHFLLSYTCDISNVLLDKRDKVLHKQFKVIPVIYPAHLLLRPVRWSFFFQAENCSLDTRENVNNWS